ncbi:MAG: hypothetical protein R3314_05700 [Longimicrobiales bacterium]|nr:hypothetical protein [Longimicrobiales bacterium]
MRDIPWPRLVIEAVLIVASILLAFAIDAWWDEARDRAVETELPEAPVLDTMLLAAIYTPTWDPGGGVDALEASGRLELIRNRDLRDRLAEWPAVVEDRKEGAFQIRRLVRRSIVPHLGSMGISLGRAFGTVMSWPPSIQSEAEAARVYRALATDSRLRALLEFRLAWQIVTVGDYASARREASEILELIRASGRN